MITGNYSLCLQNVDSLSKLNCFIGIFMVFNLTNFLLLAVMRGEMHRHIERHGMFGHLFGKGWEAGVLHGFQGGAVDGANTAALGNLR